MYSARVVAAASVVLVVACSGGGGGDGATGPTNPPAPTLQISLAAPKAFVGDSVALTWAAQQATGCNASGAWTGAQSTQGSAKFSFSTGGVRSFILACTGSGGTVTASAQLIVPLPVYPTSYANAKDIDTPVGAIPIIPPAICHTNDARAYADFLQEGTLSRFVHGSVYDSITPGTMCLQRRTANGSWEDVTSSYITDTRGCLHPRKAIVADFNRDKKPDVFTACAGWDRAPFTGEKSILLMSNAQGKYDRIELPLVAYSHGAAAADVNGDGYPDILLLDSSHNKYTFLINQGGTGAFVRDDSRLPAFLFKTSYFSTELTDVDGDGIVDVLISGFDSNDVNAGPATFLRGSPNGTFTSFTPVTWAAESGCLTTLDFLVRGGFVYLLRECSNYKGFAINKVSIASGISTLLYDAKTSGRTEYWMYFAGGKIVYDDASFSVSINP